jgi:hypothetical protein
LAEEVSIRKGGRTVKKIVTLSLVGAIVFLIVAGIGVAYAAPSKLHAHFVRPILPMPASFVATAKAEGCENNPGPFITLSGDLTLGGINAQLIFRNNVKGTHENTEEVVVSVVLIPAGDKIQFAKQPPQGGVGGNPWIYLQLLDSSGTPISDEVLLGRCVQGLSPANIGFTLLTDADVTFAADCSNNPGPFITLSGKLIFEGVNAVLIFRNNQKGTHEHEEKILITVEVLPDGQFISFAKQPPLGGVGGNPWIYLQFTDGNGKALSSEILLGRCVQMSK